MMALPSVAFQMSWMTCAAQSLPSSGSSSISRTVGPPARSLMRVIQASWRWSFDLRQPVLQHRLQVAGIGHVGAHVLVQLRRVDVDVDLLGVLRVRRQLAGDAIVEAHAEREQQVGFLDRVVDPGLAVHAHHAEVERVMGRHGCRCRAASWRRGCARARRASALPPSRRSSGCRGRRGSPAASPARAGRSPRSSDVRRATL